MYCINQFKGIHFIEHNSDKKNLPLLIILHGFPDNAFNLISLVEKHQENFHIVAPFMPGTLNNEKRGLNQFNEMRMVHDLNDLIHFVDRDSSKEIYLLGHDLGCFASVNLYYHLRSRIKGIIHLNGLGLQQFYSRRKSLSQWIKSSYVLTAQFNSVRTLVAKVFPAFFLNMIYRLGQVPNHHELYEFDRKLLSPILIYSTLFKSMRNFFGRRILRIKAPTLFLWGTKDRFLNAPTLDEVDSFYDQAEVRIIPGGHWVHLSNPLHTQKIINKKLSTWLRMNSQEQLFGKSL